MNILPLVFTFLIIFSCIAFTFFKEVRSFSLIETAIHGYNRAERVLCNTVQRRAYTKIKADTSGTTENKSQEKKQKKFTSLRSLLPPLENSKFNITPLLKHQGPLKLHPLYEPLASLLRLHYESQLFLREKKLKKLEYRLIEELVKKAQKFPDAESLADLYPDDPVLKKIYYKMLKGTNQFTHNTGITPLGNTLLLSKEEKAISLSFASPSLLEAFFGKEISSKIQQLETSKSNELNKYYYLNKEDFQNIINNTPPQSPLFAALEPFLDYSKQLTPREQIGGKDPLTGIAVQKKLN